MKIHFRSNGDSSVGIPSENITIEVSSIPYDREQVRKDILEFFAETFVDESPSNCKVWFDDECDDCGKELKSKKISCNCGL